MANTMLLITFKSMLEYSFIKNFPILIVIIWETFFEFILLQNDLNQNSQLILKTCDIIFLFITRRIPITPFPTPLSLSQQSLIILYP